jgi:hypothetical protein
MKKIILFLFVLGITQSLFAQNRIALRGGFTFTNTSVSEYDRGEGFYYYDSVLLDTEVAFPSVSINLDIDLGSNFFFTTGLSYMRKGIERIDYINGGYWYEARQEYMGMDFLLKYHYKFPDSKFGIFAAAGFRADFTVGGPNNAEITTAKGSEFFNAFGTFHPVEFALPTMFGGSYQIGPGEVTLDVNFLKGLSDILPDRFVVGRTFTMGVCLGYSLYLN